ncbi:MAG: retroviral-like aspartic protease family protein [Proteobacteria bacterium]|nr:retroviral-like aspartic protease family protein [Pseudomonadota bacterium]
MSAPEPNGDTPLMIHRTSGGKRRKGGFNPGLLVVALVAILGAVGGWVYLKYGARVIPLNALPEGHASVAEAKACLRDEDLACAEADYIAYLKKYPNDADANAVLAITLTKDGRHKEALPYYRKAQSLGVSTYDFWASYAISLDATGDLDGAIAANQASLKIVPRLVDVRGSLANQLVRKGKKQEALELLESFDRSLVDQGSTPYFTDQIARIKQGMGQAAEASADDASGAQTAGSALPAPPGTTLVQLKPGPGVLYVPVLLNGAVEADFVVDSGATDVVLSSDVAQQLMRKGKLGGGDYLGSGHAILADGSRVPAMVYNLRSLKVGGREVKNVTASVSPGKGQLLLGQSFLRRFKSWSIDNRKRVLRLED